MTQSSIRRNNTTGVSSLSERRAMAYQSRGLPPLVLSGAYQQSSKIVLLHPRREHIPFSSWGLYCHKDGRRESIAHTRRIAD